MNKRVIWLTGFVLMLTVGLIIWQRPWARNKRNSASLSPTPIKLSDFYLYQQKAKALDEVVKGTVYYLAQTAPLNNNQVKVDLYLLGDEKMKMDAADLTLNLDSNLKLQAVFKGKSFPNYPRVVKTRSSATVTGVASLKGNLVDLGKTNQIFATLIVKKIQPQISSVITIDLGNTAAFLNGETVLNPTATVKTIQL